MWNIILTRGIPDINSLGLIIRILIDTKKHPKIDIFDGPGKSVLSAARYNRMVLGHTEDGVVPTNLERRLRGARLKVTNLPFDPVVNS